MKDWRNLAPEEPEYGPLFIVLFLLMVLLHMGGAW